MPRKQWTDDEKKAFGEKMAAIRQAKKNQNPETPKVEQPLDNPIPTQAAANPLPEPAPQLTVPDVPLPGGFTLSAEQFQQLLQAVSAGQTSKDTPPSFGGASVNNQGQVIGTKPLFDSDIASYPDPRDRLFSEPALGRFGLSENNWLSWDVEIRQYELKNGMSVEEPFFTVTCYRHIFDDVIDPATGLPTTEPSGKSVLMQTFRLNEDVATARDYMNRNGIPNEQTVRKEIMDEVRYQRIRAWLYSLFFASQNFNRDDKQEMAVDGQVVTIVTNSSTDKYDSFKKYGDIVGS